MKQWELTAETAKSITNEAPLRKLNTTKKQIMETIHDKAQDGRNHALIHMEYYNVSCLEDWNNIYNWLLKLGYNVEDNSSNKFNPNFHVRW